MGVIVLEGPDGAGKSHLGEQLSKALGWGYFHDGGPSRDKQHLDERVEQFVNDKDLIRDRAALFSDAIYKRALGYPLFNSDDEIRIGIYRAVANRTLMIYVRPPMDVLLKNMEALARAKPHKPPEYANQVKQSLPLIVEEYDRNVRRWTALGLPVIHYDYTSDKVDEVVAAITEYWIGVHQ